jgi:predicted RNase H-like HicB family nuclease
MSIDPSAYNITIRRGVFEGDTLFEARIKELPDLVEYGESYEEAYELAVDAIETTAEIFAEKGKAFPVPHVPADEFSGRVTLRLPRSLHRALAEAADGEGVSLNRHLVDILSYFSGFAAGKQEAAESAWKTLFPSSSKQPSRKKPSLKVVHDNTIEPQGRMWAAG